MAGGFALPSCLCEDCYVSLHGASISFVYLYSRCGKACFLCSFRRCYIIDLDVVEQILLEILLFVIMHVRPSNSPHVIAVTHPPQGTPSASENCMLKWLNQAGTRSESFGLCWFAPATTTRRALMHAVNGLQHREERATWSWSWSRSRHGTLNAAPAIPLLATLDIYASRLLLR